MINRNSPTSLSNKSRGSAYLELIIVFILLAAIFVIIVPTYFDYVDKAKLTLAKNTASTVKRALELYQHQHHTYPARIDFSTGKDLSGADVFTPHLLEQISSDFSSVNSYSGSESCFTLSVSAADNGQTMIQLTPSGVTTGEEP